MGNVNMEASQINYRGGQKKMSVEEALKNTSGEAAAIAQLQTDVLNLNSNKANQITIAPFFSAETSYDPGDLVYYNGLSYRCVNAHEGEWDADDFAATTISGELDILKSGLTTLARRSSGVSVSAINADGATYTAPNDGYLCGTIAGNGSQAGYISVNDTEIASTASTAGTAIMIFVKSGDVIKSRSSIGTYDVRFYPWA